MKRIGISLGVLMVVGLFSTQSVQAKDLVETVARDCKAEIGRYCANINPGKGRVVACIYAHSDQVSAACGLALVDAAIEFDRVISNLALVAKDCAGDLKTYCSKVRPGENRLTQCLQSNKISAGCKEALKTGGLNEF